MLSYINFNNVHIFIIGIYLVDKYGNTTDIKVFFIDRSVPNVITYNMSTNRINKSFIHQTQL